MTSAAIVAVMAPAVERGAGFHAYADRRSWFGIPHAGDVLSNLPFVVVGVVGLRRAFAAQPLPRSLVALVFAAIAGVGFGSGAYHADPSDATLALDWAPIVLALGWLAALVVADRVDRRAGVAAALGLPALALSSVAVWSAGGGTAGGDMRWYVAVQATLVVVVALGAMVPAAAGTTAALGRGWVLAGVAAFVAARGLASRDDALLEAIGLSGHSLKHLALGVASWCLIRALPPAGGTVRARSQSPSRRGAP